MSEGFNVYLMYKLAEVITIQRYSECLEKWKSQIVKDL